MRRISPALVALALFLTLAQHTVAAHSQRPYASPPHAAALRAPFIPSPPDRTAFTGMGPVSLVWDPPSGTEQVQVQVTPFKGDGPALNLIRNADVRLNVPAPPGWYGLLPGMTYTWRVRITPETTPVT